jgi:dihydroorotate dehydrogenase (fumarate)
VLFDGTTVANWVGVMSAQTGIRDLAVTYLGLRLAHPFMAGASPLSAHLDGVRRLEDAGSAAIVLHSLFEEQITHAQTGRIHGMDPAEDPAFAARLAAFPPTSDYPFEPQEHLEHIQRVKAAVRVPVIASLNGIGAGNWLHHAALLEQAGADAIEINIYEVVTDLSRSGLAVEAEIVQAVSDVKRSVKIPVSIKLAPFFTAFGNVARRLDDAGADGLVLFNRFYQPDIDSRTLKTVPTLELSRSSELLLRLRWLAILHGRIRASLAATGGVETWNDGVKAILAGAHVVQVVSALLRHGPAMLTTMRDKLAAWMEWNEIASLESVRGRVSLMTAADPALFERANYIRALHGWTRPEGVKRP